MEKCIRAEANFPDDPVEFQQAWSQLAGKCVAMQNVVTRLNERAANLFINRNDSAADNMREMATIFSREAEALSRELDAYIKEGRRRDAEIQRLQPGHPGKYAV